MKHSKYILTSVAAVVTLITGCASDRISVGTEHVKSQTSPATARLRENGMPVTENTLGTAAYADTKSSNDKVDPVAKRSKGAWIGSRVVAIQSDSVLPPIFNEAFTVAFDDRSKGGRVSISIVAERLTRLTGVPVRIKADVHGTDTNKPQTTNSRPAPSAFASVQPPLNSPMGARNAGPIGAIPPSLNTPTSVQEFTQPITDVNSVDMKWSGSLTGFLNHVTGLLNLSWSYREGVVVIERFVTETFEVAAFGGTQDYKMSISGSSSGSGSFGSANAGMDVQESGKLAAMESLKTAISSILAGSGGSVVLNEASGRFTVNAPSDVLSRVRQVVRAEDASLQRQAHIQFDIYSVTSKDSNEAGVDWSGVINNLAQTMGATVSTPATLVGSSAGKLGYTLLKTVPANSSQQAINAAAQFGGSTAMIQALNQMGNSAQYRPVSMIALNRQWARKTSLKTTGYVSETTPSTSSSAGSGAPGLKTASVTTGDKFLVQPAILDNGTIMLKFGVSLTDLLGLFNVSAGSGSSLQTVQTPETSGTDDQGTVRLQPGEQMVITGLSRRIATSSRNGLAEEIPFVLGGSKKSDYKREDFMIVVRATQL
jgi:type IVB pilus formation R64 PilN family outer membrane protein